MPEKKGTKWMRGNVTGWIALVVFIKSKRTLSMIANMCVKWGLCVKSFSIRDRTGSNARCQNWSAASYHTSFSSHIWNDMLTKWQIDKSHLQTQRQPTSLYTVHSILSNEHQKISDLQSIHIHHEDPGVSIISKNRVFFYQSRYSGL